MFGNEQLEDWSCRNRDTEDHGLKGLSQRLMGRVVELDMVFGVPVEMSALQTGIRKSSG